MNTKELLKYHKEFSERAREIMRVKNSDYTGSNGKTPFANFQTTELLRITSTEKGFLVRMQDKMARLSTFANDGKLKVPNESFEDALLDITNYCILMGAYIKSKQKNNE
jgi:hypothetical protein